MPTLMAAVRPEGCWQLSETVSLRPEPFGALAYDFHTRRLSFLKTHLLVDVVRRLGTEADVDSALAAAGVPECDREAYLGALDRLATGGLIVERDR